MSAPLTGGCLCGRVRWIAEAPVLHRVHCHCSLCRRASGAVEVPWVTVARDGFRWTGAEPALYRSTASAERSFCPTCGSKITFVHDDLPDEVDIAVGSLAMTDSVTQARHSRLRAWGAALYRRCTAKVVPGVRDTQCGFKVMRGDVARDLLAACVSDGFSFDVELLGRAHRTRRVVVEFPVTWSDVPGSTFDPVRHGVSSFTEIAQIAWRLRTVAPAPVPLQRLRPVLPATTVAPVTADGVVL